jgi:hypothetical protein
VADPGISHLMLAFSLFTDTLGLSTLSLNKELLLSFQSGAF